MTRTYCALLSSNYLPEALDLADSLRSHEDGTIQRILFIDVAEDDQLPDLRGAAIRSPARLRSAGSGSPTSWPAPSSSSPTPPTPSSRGMFSWSKAG